MSTYWGYVCESHDPPMTSVHWFNHGEQVLTETFHKVRAGEWPTYGTVLDDPVPVWSPGGIWATTSPIDWLMGHPHCQIALHNEYGETLPIGHAARSSAP